MKLSVLVCTVPSRVGMELTRIVRSLDEQAKRHPDVEILYLGDNKRRKVGEKRNDMLKLAKGDYVTFVDDDDKVTDNYIDEILKAISGGADVINFKVMCRVNRGQWKPVEYDATFPRDRNTAKGYERLPNHIMAIKRELALSVGFKDMQSGEDFEFARRLREKIKTQTKIDKVLYFYDADLRKSETQNGV
jgi:glycosyltransferase involved in cell wall biosynthesis